MDLERLERAIGRARYKTKVWFRAKRRQIFLRMRDRGLAESLETYRAHVARQDWAAAAVEAREIGAAAKQQGDWRLLAEVSQGLERMGEYGAASELKLARRRLLKEARRGEWFGEDLSGKTLLIDLMETEKQGLATALRHVGSTSRAIQRAGRTIVLVERRLVPLFQRTLPDADVRPVDDREAAYREADAFAGVQHLAALFENEQQAIREGFVPLKPDPDLVKELRASYAGDGAKLVGIAWASSAFGKDLPPLAAWKRLLDLRSVRFVSLQYGRIEEDVAVLRGQDPGRIIVDRSVDQLVDMDRFAAQVAAMDAIATISNTGAHLAGSLGMPTVIILGDMFKRSWPIDADRTPYYPSATLVWKRQRPWEDHMEHATLELAARLGLPAA